MAKHEGWERMGRRTRRIRRVEQDDEEQGFVEIGGYGGICVDVGLGGE